MTNNTATDVGPNPKSAIRFIHIRPRDSEGRPEGRGGITVAYKTEGDTLTYATAFCHWRDQYCKATGRVKSSGRLLSKSAVKMPAPEDKHFISAIMEHLDGEMEKVELNQKTPLANLLGPTYA